MAPQRLGQRHMILLRQGLRLVSTLAREKTNQPPAAPVTKSVRMALGDHAGTHKAKPQASKPRHTTPFPPDLPYTAPAARKRSMS
jgi:hypothetical protein